MRTKKLRHSNRMFKHTYVEPLPESMCSINEHFAKPEFAAEVAHRITERVFALTINPGTWEFGRKKLYDLLEVYKACNSQKSSTW